MIPLDEVVKFNMVASDPTTGAKSAASPITFSIYEDATDTVMAAYDATAMTARTVTGHYRGIFTASVANGFGVGQWYNVLVEATVGGVTAAALAMTFRLGPAEVSAGIPDVNAMLINDVSASAVTTVKAVQGIAVDGVITTLTNLPAITANWLTAAGINADAITEAKIADNAIATEHLATGAITAATLATDTITAAKIAAAAITDSEFTATGSGLSAIAAVGDVTNLSNLPTIPTNWITAAGINADAITEAKIADNALANEHFAAGALTATEITSSAGAAVTSIATDVITATVIQAGAIDSSNVADGAITAAKITALSAAGWTALDDQYDGSTGLVGDLYPATQLQMGGLTSGTAAINTVATTFNSTVGGAPTNSITDTYSENLVYHIVPPSGADTDIDYTFDVGGNGIPVSITWLGYATSNGDSYTVWAWNYTGSPAWEQIGTIDGTISTSPVTNTYSLTNQHVGTGASIGEVKWRVLSADGTNFATDRLLCSYAVVAQSVGYADGAIWVDSAGTAGAVDYVNGTADNPCPWANALTISASLGLTRFHITSGNTVTLSANSDGYTLLGEAWTLALGGQSIVGAYILGANISGVSSGTGTTQKFDRCLMGAVSHIAGTHMIECGVTGTQTIIEAGDHFWDRCHSGVAGTGTPAFDFGAAVGNTNLNIRNYSGGIQFESMGDTGTDTASVEGRGQFVEGTCTGGTVAIRGHFTVSGITNLTLSDDARIDVAQINAEADTALADYDGPTNTEFEARTISSTAATNLESSALAIIPFIVSGTPTTTSMDTNITGIADTHMIGREVLFASGTAIGQRATILTYTSVSGVITYAAINTASVSGDTGVVV